MISILYFENLLASWAGRVASGQNFACDRRVESSRVELGRITENDPCVCLFHVLICCWDALRQLRAQTNIQLHKRRLTSWHSAGLWYVGYAVLSVWSWRHVCSADALSWNISFIIINSLQVLVIVSRLRPICLSPSLQQLYTRVFEPLKMSRFHSVSFIIFYIGPPTYFSLL